MINILNVMISCFTNYGMKANPDTFQVIFFDKYHTYKNKFITLGHQTLIRQENVKLFGVHLDSQLNFTYHMSEICKKTGYKLNVLARLSKTLETKEKMLFSDMVF